jgi:hypothetical protein
MWSVAPGEEVFISYGHETGVELLASYGFFPEPNAGDFVPVYMDLQELLDDDRWVEDGSHKVMRAKESMLFSMAAVDAPLAVRQGLTLAHFSAQPMPFWTVSRFVSCLSRVVTRPSTEGSQRVPHMCLR